MMKLHWRSSARAASRVVEGTEMWLAEMGQVLEEAKLEAAWAVG